MAEGGPYSDDPSRNERPANHDPYGEQLNVASQHEPGIISGKGQYSRHHPHEDPKKEEDRSQDFLSNSSAMSRVHRRSAKRHKLVGGDAGVAVHRRDNVSQWPLASQNRKAFLLNQLIGNCNGLAELTAESVRTRSHSHLPVNSAIPGILVGNASVRTKVKRNHTPLPRSDGCSRFTLCIVRHAAADRPANARREPAADHNPLHLTLLLGSALAFY
jgi:hypothetical protein